MATDNLENKPVVTGFKIFNYTDSQSQLPLDEVGLSVIFDNIYNNKQEWKTLRDVLFGKYDYQRDADGQIVKDENGIAYVTMVDHYPVDENNNSVWQEMTVFEQEISRRLFGIYKECLITKETYDGSGNIVTSKIKEQVYTGSFLDKKAIVVQDKPVQDIYGYWYFPPELNEKGEFQYVTKNGRVLTAIEAYYKTPNFEMKQFTETSEDGNSTKTAWYPVASSGLNSVSQEFAEYLYDCLNNSSMVQDLLAYSRFWNTLASEDWEEDITYAVISKGEIDALYGGPDSRYATIANGGMIADNDYVRNPIDLAEDLDLGGSTS